MKIVGRPTGLFPAQMKFWRGRRGMSQLDLAMAADVSPRHVSFLETGRARPSEEMVLRLAAALRVPLRDQNALLHAAGFQEIFDTPEPEQLSPPIARALERMLHVHDPFPMLVMDRHYHLVRSNRGSAALFARFVADPSALRPPINLVRAVFDPQGARPFIVGWKELARELLGRIFRESLASPSDDGLAALLDDLLAYPGVPSDWRQPEFSSASEPVATVTLARDDTRLSFLTAVTAFSAPQNVTLEELRIESYFPLDEATESACVRMAAH